MSKPESSVPAPRVAGDVVEDFTLLDQDGVARSLSDVKSGPVVLFFYPRADTPGCTIEVCGFRDNFTKLQAAGVTLLGISRDTVKAQKKFKEKYALPYTLLADPEEQVCRYFDVIKPKSMYGKLVKGVERITFVLRAADAEGKQRILHTFTKVKPEGHADEVLALLTAAQ